MDNILALQADIARKKQILSLLLYLIKNNSLTMQEAAALKKAADVFKLSIDRLETALKNELEKEGKNNE